MRITVNSPLRDFLNKIYLELIETNVFKLDEKKIAGKQGKYFSLCFHGRMDSPTSSISLCR